MKYDFTLVAGWLAAIEGPFKETLITEKIPRNKKYPGKIVRLKENSEHCGTKIPKNLLMRVDSFNDIALSPMTFHTVGNTLNSDSKYFSRDWLGYAGCWILVEPERKP